MIIYLLFCIRNRFSNDVFLMYILDHYIIISLWILTIYTIYSIVAILPKIRLLKHALPVRLVQPSHSNHVSNAKVGS